MVGQQGKRWRFLVIPKRYVETVSIRVHVVRHSVPRIAINGNFTLKN